MNMRIVATAILLSISTCGAIDERGLVANDKRGTFAGIESAMDKLNFLMNKLRPVNDRAVKK